MTKKEIGSGIVGNKQQNEGKFFQNMKKKAKNFFGSIKSGFKLFKGI